ncbi:putative piggyBac transposable element-derived protein 3 [Trichinella spiralis]|uniref:PiggyBac transposable element-derived protein 3 n=1 Tax=Trichinella spiralis TaxID=6334 RepID=E5SYR3_TRISP|nr:putative piggyBac transposable element-derived protein 3 [Trichinella spiralis]KRY27152.1 PiggyBac transposable element-derived protein 3 [Trichinella spiralis]
MYVRRWNDNTAVTISSNYYTHFPVGTIKRFSRTVKKHVDVAEPNIIRQYNQFMGGVHVMDKMLPSYGPKIKKWWWNLFSHALNMAVVAAWKLHIELHTAPSNQLPHLELRKKPPGATVTLTNKPPDISRTLPPIMYPRTMYSLPKKLQK